MGVLSVQAVPFGDNCNPYPYPRASRPSSVVVGLGAALARVEIRAPEPSYTVNQTWTSLLDRYCMYSVCISRYCNCNPPAHVQRAVAPISNYPWIVSSLVVGRLINLETEKRAAEPEEASSLVAGCYRSAHFVAMSARLVGFHCASMLRPSKKLHGSKPPLKKQATPT